MKKWAVFFAGCMLMSRAVPASADPWEVAPDAVPNTADAFREPQLGGYSFGQEEPEYGSFQLNSALSMESKRMPLLVDIFPNYSPTRGISAWGRGWGNAALSISRTNHGHAPRFDNSDQLQSQWGTLVHSGGVTWYPLGFGSRVSATVTGSVLTVREESGVVWRYSGELFEGAFGSARWMLDTVSDLFGNQARLSYTEGGELKRAEWTIEGNLIHAVDITYEEMGRTFLTFVAGKERRLHERVKAVVIRTLNRHTASHDIVAEYDFGYEQRRPWYLLRVTEKRPGTGETRETGYWHDAPWVNSDAAPKFNVAWSAGSLPTYPNLVVPEHALTTAGGKPLRMKIADFDNDGIMDFHGAANAWWVHDLRTDSYIMHGQVRYDETSPCLKRGANATTLFIRSGEEKPWLFNLEFLGEDRFALTQCSHDGTRVKRHTLRLKRGSVPDECAMMTAGPLSDAGGYRHSFADLNSDGTPDLVMADRCSLLVWFGKLDGAALIPGQKTGHVFEPSIVEISGLDATNQPQLVDMNGDGLVDVVASNDTWRVWYNKGLTQRSSPDAPPDRPVFSDPVQLPVMGGFVTGYYPCHRFLMQLDGDPSMDLVSYCPDSETDFNNLFFYRGSPDGFFPLRKLENVPGLALPVKITSTGDSALTFVAKAPTPRNKDDSCPKETAGGRDSGANGPRYWCSPLVQWMSLRDANSDLLTKVSNFRGVTVKYEYRWDPLRPGFGGARSVVDNRTVSITGQTPISTRYSFEDPWLDDAGDFGGYGYIRAEERDVTSPRFSRTRSVKYDHEHGLSWPVERHVESHDGHKRSWFTPHDVITYAGVPLLRPVAIRLEAAIGSVVAPGEGRLLTSTEFEYGRETPFDPQTVITKQLGGRAFTRIQKIGYVRPAGLHGTLAWLPWRVATRGSHPGDGTLNYDQNDQSTYSGTGLLESQSRVSRDERLLLIKRKYSPRGLIEEETRLGAGTVRYQYAKVREGSDVDTALLEHVDLPQGRHQDFEYWPVTDLPKSYTRSEGGTPHRINWEFDPYGNPLVEYDTQFGPGPSRTFTHREASTDRLGYDVVVTRFAGKERWEMTLFDGNREPLATASVRSDRKPGISDTPWTIEEARVHDKASGSWVRFRGGVMDLGWPSAPTLTQLLNAKGKVILQQGTQRPSSRSSEWTEYTAPNAMRERWRSIPTLNTDGTLTVTARSTSGRVRLETYDGADRVVKTVSPGGLRVETVYDAEGRARRFRLPGNSETSTYDASIDYDALGRVTDTERDGVRTIYTYRPGHQRPKCIDSKPVTFGESRTECYDWSAFGEIIQRRAFIDGMLEDTVSWSYPPNSVQPQYIQGKGFRKAFSYDQSGRNTSVTIELFPEPGDQTPWRTIRFESKPLVSGVTESQGIFVSRGPIVEKSYEYRATYDRHGFPSGIWGSPWGGVDITKQRLETVTKYLAGGASLREVTHLDGLRRPDVISAFDKSGQTMRIAREGGGGADTASEVVQFGGVEEKAGFSFNADGQLVTAFRMRPGADTYYQVYSYDERGLLSTKAEGQGLQLTTTPVVRTNGNIVLGSRHWKLDHFGRVVETPTATFTWNATNQVKSVRKDGRKYDYVYDEVGQRLFRTTVAGDGTRSTVAWIDGMRIADGEPVRFPVEVDGQLLGLWESGSEGMVRVGQDGIGTLRLFDGAKVSLDDRFGTKSTYLMKVPEFAGGFFDEVLGMVRLGVRDYIPDLAQFSSKDPLFEAHPELCRSNPVSCNLYTYARSNPIDRWDPTGLRDISGYCDVSNQSCPESVGLDAHPTVLEQLASRSMTTRDVSDPEEALKHTGSFSLGYSGLIALGFALSLEFSHIFLNGEERLGLTWGWGGGGVGASLGPSVGWSNARSFDQMAGDGYLVSPRGIVAFGASRFGGNGYDGTSVGLGVGWGIPMGGLQTYTWLVPVPRAASAGSVRGHMLGGGL